MIDRTVFDKIYKMRKFGNREYDEIGLEIGMSKGAVHNIFKREESMRRTFDPEVIAIVYRCSDNTHAADTFLNAVLRYFRLGRNVEMYEHEKRSRHRISLAEVMGMDRKKFSKVKGVGEVMLGIFDQLKEDRMWK